MHFIKGREKNLYIPKSNKPDFSVGCKFQVSKYRSDGTITYKGPVFNNLTLNCGLDALASYAIVTATAYCNVGTGTSAPDAAQTGLSFYLPGGSSNTLYVALSNTVNAVPPTYFSLKRTFSFPIGSVTGILTEVGLSRLSNASYFNRQLFKDINGVPTAITVLADEGIRVEAEIFVYSGMETADSIAGSFLLNGATTIDYLKDINLGTTLYGFLHNTSYSLFTTGGVLGNVESRYGAELSSALTGYANGTYPDALGTSPAYVAGSFTKTVTYTWLAGTFANTINTIFFNVSRSTDSTHHYLGHRLYGFRLTPGITKLSTEELTLSFSRSWGRYVP